MLFVAVVFRYRDSLYFADQDILNAVFGLAPWYLYELPCHWNYVVWQCREETWLGGHNPRTGRGQNNCPGADRFGVSLLHGNSLTFYNQDQLREDLFRHIFDYWSVVLNKIPRHLLLFLTTRFDFEMKNIPEELAGSPAKLRKIISRVVQNTSHLSEEEDTSPCARVPNIEFIITKRLEFNIQQNFKENQFSGADLRV